MKLRRTPKLGHGDVRRVMYAIASCGGSVEWAASELGVAPGTLRNFCSKHRILGRQEDGWDDWLGGYSDRLSEGFRMMRGL